jgi:paired amphipathic helix protein Sin3a
MFSLKFNESYHKLLDAVPQVRNSTDDPIALEHCNTAFISGCIGADKTVKENSNKNYESGVLKKNSMKNVFEENLFKLEDERFEIDIHIERFKAAIRWLNEANSLAADDKTVYSLLDKLKKFQLIELIYGNKSDELFAGMVSHRANVVPVVLKRIEEKLEVLKECKARYEVENWTQGYEANFHRSLDQKSFSIKYYDRKMVVSKSRHI